MLMPAEKHAHGNHAKELLKQQDLLAKIGLKITKLDDFSKTMNTILRDLGKFAQVNRVYIFEDCVDGLTTSNTYEWVKKGTSPEIKNLQDIPYTSIPTWKKLLDEEEIIISSDITMMKKDIREILEAQGIKSLLAFPILTSEKKGGFIGFDDTETNREWSVGLVKFLKIIATMISNAYLRAETENRYKKQQDRISIAIDVARAGIWDWDIPNSIFSYSESWMQILGYNKGLFSKSELGKNPARMLNYDQKIKKIQEGINKLYHPDDLKRMQDDLPKFFSGKQKTWRYEIRMKHKEGHWVWVLNQGKIIERDTKKKPTRMLGVHVDITEQKNREEKVRASVSELEKFNKLMVGRELKMVQLKNQIDELKKKLAKK
jgi:PAS domain-containing protein